MSYKFLEATKLTPDFRKAVVLKEEAIPKPGPSEVVVRVVWAGVNASDVNWSAGRYIPGMQPPFRCGFEGVGQIAAAGEAVKKLKVGAPVLTRTIGAFAEYQLLEAKHCIPLPALSPKFLPVPVNGITALAGLEIVGEPKEGETALVTAAAGGTGQFAVQILKKKYKCHVIGTCSGGAKAEFLKSIGCDRVVDYKKESLMKVLKTEYKKGIDVCFESVGGNMFETAMRNMAIKGRLIVIGAIEGYTGKSKLTETKEKPPNWLNMICISKSVRVQGFLLTHLHPRDNYKYMKEMMTMVHTGEIISAIDPSTFKGVESCSDAVEYLHTGKSFGKVAVTIQQPLDSGAGSSKL